MQRNIIPYEKREVIRQLELVKNIETPIPEFFYVERVPKLSIGLDFETKSVEEFLIFTNQTMYERLFIFECDKQDIDDLEVFLFLCLTFTCTSEQEAEALQQTFKGFNDLSPLNEQEFIEETSLYVNDHFFEELIKIDIEIPVFVAAYQVFKDVFFYCFEGETLFRLYGWERYI